MEGERKGKRKRWDAVKGGGRVVVRWRREEGGGESRRWRDGGETYKI